jgi:hypothetical protein
LVTLTATGDSCDSPLYEFWEYMEGDPAGWKVVQPFSTTATYAWDTSTSPDGAFDFEVWIKDTTSSSPYDTYAVATYSLQGTGAPCTNALLSENVNSPEPAGTSVTFTGASSTCGTPQYEFWQLAPGGQTPWTIVQPWSDNASYVWDTSAASFAAYEFEVWVRDSTSTSMYDTNAITTYTITPAGTCGGGAISATPSSPQNLGAQVIVSGSADECGSPLYQFWVLAPGGQTAWTIVQPWSAASTYAWDTSTDTSGTYLLDVWAKDASSQTATYDTSGILSFELDGSFAPCANATLTPTPGSPEPVGTLVTLTGVATSCSAPLYQFWELAPGAGWTIVQPYGVATTYAWDTSGSAAGDYLFAVWTRDAQSTAAYDSQDDEAFTLQ